MQAAAQAAAKASSATAVCPPPAFSLLRVRGLPQEHSWCAQVTLELFIYSFVTQRQHS